MIAEAIQATAPAGITNVTVDLASIRFTDAQRRLRFIYMTPRLAAIALIDFDRGIKPQPFSFKLPRVYQITRVRPPHDLITNDERQKRRANRKKERNVVLDQITTTNDMEPFDPPREYAEKVVAAMEDPNLPLGPAVMLRPENGSADAVPTIVGGNPARHHGNIISANGGLGCAN